MLEICAVIPADVCAHKADVVVLQFVLHRLLLIAVTYIAHSVQHVIIHQQVAITAQLFVTNVQEVGLPVRMAVISTAAVVLVMYTLKDAIQAAHVKLKYIFRLLLEFIVHKAVT
jgi:hypothetical protein